MLEYMLNDDDARDIGNYKKLSDKQLQQLLDHCSKNIPNWQEINRFDLCEIVPRLFPSLVKKRSRATTPSARDSTGCMALLLALILLLPLALFISWIYLA